MASSNVKKKLNMLLQGFFSSYTFSRRMKLLFQTKSCSKEFTSDKTGLKGQLPLGSKRSRFLPPVTSAGPGNPALSGDRMHRLMNAQCMPLLRFSSLSRLGSPRASEVLVSWHVGEHLGRGIDFFQGHANTYWV